MQVLSPFFLPKAILHVDGDAFFASCAQALNPQLRGRPVVVGRERGMATAVSYQAKSQGIKRGMPISEIRQVCPQCVIVDSDYQAYSLFSLRMSNLVKRHTPQVEDYSIDECFADLTGLQRPFNCSYSQLAQKIKKDLEENLGMTFSVGLAPNKVLSKIASGYRKPSGLVIIPANKAHIYLNSTSRFLGSSVTI